MAVVFFGASFFCGTLVVGAVCFLGAAAGAGADCFGTVTAGVVLLCGLGLTGARYVLAVAEKENTKLISKNTVITCKISVLFARD
ncbi:hypothetical protein MASR1M90_04940 [Desulfovibrionales bacterium]